MANALPDGKHVPASWTLIRTPKEWDEYVKNFNDVFGHSEQTIYSFGMPCLVSTSRYVGSDGELKLDHVVINVTQANRLINEAKELVKIYETETKAELIQYLTSPDEAVRWHAENFIKESS